MIRPGSVTRAESTTVTVEVEVESTADDVLPAPYSSRRWRPTRLYLSWRRDNGGPFELSATLYGPVVRKDGSDSPALTERVRLTHRGELLADTAGWVRSLIDEHAPGGPLDGVETLKS